jgi:uncharacterized membrane protein YgdD (TMEM256/DUF423 family)
MRAFLPTFAALMGAGGVGLAAAAAHGGGDSLAQTAALFLILHAATLLGVSAHAQNETRRVLSRALAVAGYGLGFGATLFSADLAMRSFAGTRLFPFAAPIGGSAMILFWLVLAIMFAAAAFYRDGTA